MLKKGIKITKSRIQNAEKHGIGTVAMEEKDCLKKQERLLQKLKDSGLA